MQEVQLGALLQEKALQLKTLAEKNALIGFLIASISAILLAFAAFYWWIRQRQAKKEAANQAQFTRQLLEHVEDDRGRIAIDLHDSVSHDLLLLKQSIRKEITGPEVGDKIDGIINGIRQISRNLHPVMLDKIGLGLSLETLCEQFMLHETMYVSHDIKYKNTLSKTAELQLFRIVQEGLTNALKYSKAEAVKVQIKSSGNTLRLEIQDNGKGFDVEKALAGGKAFGLHSILQRAKALGGKAEIRSGDGGTTIVLTIH
ncbi:MAG: sensor histidine kinase [Lewinellaceae bacterium]|nr:sensor histidine kinase [Lewinellaceae bacterium]